MGSEPSHTIRTPYSHVVKTEGVCGGEAIVEGTRIAVWHLVGYYYKVGMSVEEMLNDSITEEIRDTRRKLAAQFDNDVSRIFADVRQREASDGHAYVTLPKRPAGRQREIGEAADAQPVGS